MRWLGAASDCGALIRCLGFSLIVWVASVPAAIINVGPGDTYTKIESAQPGDEVVIAPGTYAFRVYLTRQASVTNPIIIQAQDPSNRPVWDFGTNLVENAPGSYTAGDRGRGAWQFSGARNYSISGIVFRNCRTASMNSAGLRYYNGTTNLYIKDCLFVSNDNGLTGGTQESQATVQFCEFATNGNLLATSPTHNLYIYGGTFTLRYCYVHDSLQSQNFHIRARAGTLEFNWFARAKSYEGDLMTDDDFSGTGPFSQSLTLRGNVFVQAAAPDNHSQVFVLYNDAGQTNLTMSARVLYNTFVGNGGNAAFVHLSNATGTPMSAEESDNIVSGTTLAMLVENTNAGSVSGVNNWCQPTPTRARSATPSGRRYLAFATCPPKITLWHPVAHASARPMPRSTDCQARNTISMKLPSASGARGRQRATSVRLKVLPPAHQWVRMTRIQDRC